MEFPGCLNHCFRNCFGAVQSLYIHTQTCTHFTRSKFINDLYNWHCCMINESHNLFHICFETWCYITTLNHTVTIPGIESNTNVLSVLFSVAAYSLVLGILLIENGNQLVKVLWYLDCYWGQWAVHCQKRLLTIHTDTECFCLKVDSNHTFHSLFSLSSLYLSFENPHSQLTRDICLDVRRKADIMGRNEITPGSYLTSFFHLKSLLHLLHISFLGFDDS